MDTPTSYKSLVRSQEQQTVAIRGFKGLRTVIEQAESMPINPLMVHKPAQFSQSKSAQQTASQLENYTGQLEQNHERLELGVRYYTQPGFRVWYNFLAGCRNVFGGEVEKPSLPQLLDLQESTLGNYTNCLGRIGSLVDEQRSQITAEVDQMEKQLAQYAGNAKGTDLAHLRSVVQSASSHHKKRAALEKLYEHDREMKNTKLSQDFFAQYVTQELVLGDVRHSLTLLEDHTTLFGTYIAKSKHFFVSMDSIGEAVAHMAPVVAQMKTQTAYLQNSAAQVTGYLQEQSDQPLFLQGRKPELLASRRLL